MAYGIYTVRHIPVDAIPDLSDTQVIVYSRWDRSPDIMEDQVTYPIVTALLGAPNVKVIRGFSDFGFSLRLRDLQGRHGHLLGAQPRPRVPVARSSRCCPPGVQHGAGPDATGVAGSSSTPWWTTRGTHSLADLRTFQDWNLRYRLQSVPGVAEVASLGGFVQQYQVTVDPNRLKAYDLAIMDVTEAVRASNNEVAAACSSSSGREYMVRGRGYVRVERGPREDRPQDRRAGHARPAARRGQRRASGPRSGAASPTSTAGATRSAASS